MPPFQNGAILADALSSSRLCKMHLAIHRSKEKMMKRVIYSALIVGLSGCAVDMQHPTKTVAEQQLDRGNCQTSDRRQAVNCLKAKGYVAVDHQPFPFDDIQ